MANNYFDFLEQNSSDNPASSTLGNNNEGMVKLTTRADAECQVVCDGDFLFLLPPNQIIKEKAPLGQHILQFISTEYPDVIVEKVVDFPEVGKNYLVMVSDFQSLLADRIKKAAEEEAAAEAKARAEAEEARIKAEAETIVSVEFVSEICGKGTYTGHLKDGKPEGEGKAVFESGAIFEGGFHNGSLHGTGVYRKSDGWLYEGEFKEDNWNGKGKLSAPDGRVWEGEFLNGCLHGKTKLFFSNGDTLEGIWENGDVANKPVVYTWDNGERFECEGYINGLNGQGVHYYPDGRFREEYWENGRKDESSFCFADLGLSVKWADSDVRLEKRDNSSEYEVIGAVYPQRFKMKEDIDLYQIKIDGQLLNINFAKAPYRVPTLDEIKELINKCDWERWGDFIKVKSRVNSNYIEFFLTQGDGWFEEYWSSTRFGDHSNYVLKLSNQSTYSKQLRAFDCAIRLVK